MDNTIEYLKNKNILYHNDTLTEGGTEQVVEAMKEYGYDVVDRCIEVIANHCKESREMGMLPGPDKMLKLLDEVKNEIK